MGIQINGQTDTISAVDGSITVATDLTVPGALTYDDVTNIDSVGIITARSGVNITGGDLTLPDAIIHTGDTNTRIRFPASDTFTVETAGNERLRITSGGNIGIGTDNPETNFQVRKASESEIRATENVSGHYVSLYQQAVDSYIIAGKSSGTPTQALRFYTGGSEKVRITSDGKFGYGTATPGCFFEVSDDAAGATVQQKLINRNTAANSNTNQFIYVNNSAAGDPFTTWTVGGVTSWSMGIDNSDSDKLKITAASNLNSNQYLTLDTSGNIGINKTPYTKLDIHNGSDASVIVSIEGADSSSEYLGFGINSGEAVITAGGNGSTSNALVFRTAPSGTETERLRITDSGYLKHTGLRSGNNQNKLAILTTPSYNTGEEDVALYIAENESGSNQITFGGGTSAYNAATNIRFITASAVNTTTGTERLRIASDGNITLGYAGNSLYFQNGFNNRASRIQNGGGSGSADLKFYTNNAGTEAERLRITAAGNLGIGLGDPGTKLEVSGGQNQTANQFTDLLRVSANANNDSIDAEVQLNFGIMPSHTSTGNRRSRIQSTTHAGTARALAINPDGGNVGVGVDNPSVMLDVRKATAGTIARFYDTGSNGGALYNGAPIMGLSRVSNGNISLDGLFFQIGWDKNNSNSYNIDETVFAVGNKGVGVRIDSPAEHLHIKGAVRRDHSTSNIKFYEFSFELPSGTTTTIATVTGPVVSSMAIAKFEYVGLYDYADVGFYSGVEMASLRRSNSNSAYTYLQNSQIHAGGNNSNYQPNMFWQNGSNNTSDLMITTGSYVLIMGTMRITTYNLGFTRVISV